MYSLSSSENIGWLSTVKKQHKKSTSGVHLSKVILLLPVNICMPLVIAEKRYSFVWKWRFISKTWSLSCRFWFWMYPSGQNSFIVVFCQIIWINNNPFGQQDNDFRFSPITPSPKNVQIPWNLKFWRLCWPFSFDNHPPLIIIIALITSSILRWDIRIASMVEIDNECVHCENVRSNDETKAYTFANHWWAEKWIRRQLLENRNIEIIF